MLRWPHSPTFCFEGLDLGVPLVLGIPPRERRNMTSPNTPGRAADEQSRIYAMLQDATTIESVEKVLHAISEASATLDSSNLWFLRRNAIDLIREFSSLDTDRLAEFALAQIVPLCSPANDAGGGDFDLREMDSFRARQYLYDWLYGFPAELMIPIRKGVMSELEKRLRTNPHQEILWIISRIGYRESSLVDLLWNIADRESQHSDAAVSTLISLGPKKSDRERILEIVTRKLEQDQIDDVVTLAIQELVGPEYIELAEWLLEIALANSENEPDRDLSLAISVATRAVDRCDANTPANDRIWNLIREEHKIVTRSGEYGYRCASSQVVTDYFDFVLECNDAPQDTTRNYILLSRLRDLLKPIHLENWRSSRTDTLVRVLESLARLNTENTGNFHTIKQSLKKESLDILATFGHRWSDNLIHDVILGETNAFASSESAATLACFQINAVPDTILQAVKSAENIDQTGDQHVFRQKGIVDLVRSSNSRSAFEAILQFGFSHNGYALLSTVAAIVDLAFCRIREGDEDVIETLLHVSKTAEKECQRDAAISAFCSLAKNGFVPARFVSSLWSFASDGDLQSFSRGDALEAIGAIDVPETEQWRGGVVEIAKADEPRLSWQAWDCILKRGWLSRDVEQLLHLRLGIEVQGEKLRIKDATETEGWQGYLIGMLFASNQMGYEKCVVDCLNQGQPETVYQLTAGLKAVGKNCLPSIGEALASRLTKYNTDRTSESGLFKLLSNVAPTALIGLAASTEWQDWLPETKYAYSESVRSCTLQNNGLEASSVGIFFELMTDPAYQVRRSAYRACSEIAGNFLFQTCSLWSRIDDIELRKRAAEAAAWLPLQFDDSTIRELGFSEDPEPAVRKAWKGVLLERRQRAWLDSYLRLVLDHCGGDNDQIASHFRYGMAVARLGDDDSIQKLIDKAKDKQLSANGRHWLHKILKETRKQWKETTSKWPEPWADQRDSIEIVDGEIGLGDSIPVPARITLWRQQSKSLLGLYEWGGVAEELPGSISRSNAAFDDYQMTLLLPGRSPTAIIFNSSNFESSGKTRLKFFSNDPYPSETK
ncbi:hypothetical protein-transmembrane prediction [Rhodopirellula baltica SH 1]|uniref:Uncharacterized protein n=3 Tax=Rhodopirellula baltica TaxID=265606 RepID=Q7UKA3_RHOBA|nr:hypothetical protein-transmembrane prediction [Rhodopirellula baltica SH 1]